MSEANNVPADGGQGVPPVDPNTALSPPAPPPPPPEPFYESLKNPDLRGYAETKGWKGDDPVTFAETVIDSYRNFEKLKGVPQDRLLTLPENLDDPAAVAPILAKLGYAPPEKADDYGLVTMPDVDPAFAKVAQDWMHEAGLTPKQAQMLAAKQIAWQAEQDAAAAQAHAQQVEAEMALWRQENGARHDEVMETARRAARVVGISAETLATLEGTLGSAEIMKMFARFGDMIGESTFIRAEDKPKGFTLSPEGARSKINQLRGDQDFARRLLAGDSAAKAEWDRLHVLASAEGAA